MISGNLKTNYLYKFIIIILLSISVVPIILSTETDEYIDIVFDLDWTLVSEIENDIPTGGEIIDISGKKYQISSWAKEMLAQISSRPNVRISFYSGGDSVRNIEVLKATIIPPENISAYDLAYRVLSKNDMEEVSKDQNLRFSERFKKNLNNIVISTELSKEGWGSGPSIDVLGQNIVNDLLSEEEILKYKEIKIQNNYVDLNTIVDQGFSCYTYDID